MDLDDSYDQATLTFREQADGRKVARLPSGKVVLVELASVAKVHDGERWLVRLDHKDMFAIARPVERLEAVTVTSVHPATVPLEPLPFSLGGRPRPPVPVPAPETKAVALPAPVVSVVTSTRPETVVEATDRVAIFIDGANTDGACRDAGFFLDFGKVRKYFQGGAAYYGGFYYVADFTAKDPMQIRFLDFLSHQQFIVRKKAVKVLHDAETGEERYKANVDTEIVVDMLNTADNYDVAFLLSGDSDFERLVDVLRSRGKRIYVVSSRNSLSRELAYVADKPVFYLEEHRREVERGPNAVAAPTLSAAELLHAR